MMTKNDLVILGLLKEQPMYGYQIKHQIQFRELDHWAQVSLPSIYNTLNRLQKKGYIVAHQERVGKTPERTVYRITPKGEIQLARLVEKALVDENIPEDNFAVGIAFMYGLEKEKAERCLEKKIDILKKHLAHLKEDLRKHRNQIPFNWVYLIQNGIDHIRMEMENLMHLRKLMKTRHTWHELIHQKKPKGRLS
jgi:DNA-binding PadR family transcriptional regulator